MGRVLLLNSTYEPLGVITWKKAITLLFQEKVEILKSYEISIRSVRVSIRLPSVLKLCYYIKITKNMTYVRFSRENVLLRDNYTCQYCDKSFPSGLLTLDHVIPAAKGGRRTWENIVTSCRKCNQKKGQNSPARIGMKLIRKPAPPSLALLKNTFPILAKEMNDDWREYFRQAA